MKKIRWIIPLCGLMGMVGGGCIAMPKMLPAEYFEPGQTITIEVAGGLPTPTLHTDQPKGNVAGMTWLTREQAMQNRMAGITTHQIHAAVEKALAKQLADTFSVVPRDAPLALKVAIDDWGWYVPTGKYGESKDIHYFRIGGTARIVDSAQNGEEVYFTYNSTDTPLGDHLTKEKCEATLPKAADDFAAQIVRFILKGKSAKP